MSKCSKKDNRFKIKALKAHLSNKHGMLLQQKKEKGKGKLGYVAVDKTNKKQGSGLDVQTVAASEKEKQEETKKIKI